MTRKGLVSICLVFFSVSAALGIASAQEDKTVVVKGVGPIVEGNIANARNVATNDAYRRAVEQVLGVLVDAQTIIKNDLLHDDRLFAQTRGFIKDSAILGEREISGLYEVTMRVTVSTKSIKDSLFAIGVIKKRMDYPRMVILYHPKETLIPTSALSAEISMVKFFTEKHFDLVDPSKSRQLHKEAQELLKIDTLDNVAARIALNHYAEVVIVYRIEENYAGNDGTFEHARSILQSRVIVSTTSQILTTDEKVVPGVGTTKKEALRDSASKLGKAESEYLMDQIFSWWDEYTNNGIPYIITLKGPKNTDLPVITFEERVEQIPGVVSLNERFTGGGVTEMMIKYKGLSKDLRREIYKALRREKGFEDLHTVLSKGRFMVFSMVKGG